MTFKINTNPSIVLLLIAFCVSSCQKKDSDYNQPTETYQFHLALSNSNESQNEIETKSIGNLNVKYFISDKQGNVINDVFAAYDTQLETITIEPIRPGEYELFVLAYTPALEKEGFIVASTLTTKKDTWIHFSKDNIGLMKDRSLLFGKCQFKVGNTTSHNADVALSNVFSAVALNTKFPNKYTNDILTKVSVSLEPSLVHNSLSLDGELSGSVQLIVNNDEVEHNSQLYTFPSSTDKLVNFNVNTETVNHDRLKYKSNFEGITNTSLRRGVKNIINVDLSNHPDSNTGTIYINRKVHNSKDRPKILQDSESKSVYYNSSQRSFYVNKPLQITFTEDNKLHTRFYSPVPVQNVEIWAKFPDFKEELLIAYLDTIPAFSDAKYDIQIDETSLFKTRSNKYTAIQQRNIDNFANATLSIESSDRYMKKIETIRCDWWNKFTSFGGNPDLPNGGPAGNWMGIRPVHIREAVGLMTNLAYMFSSPKFEAYLATFQGRLYGNKGKEDILDVTTLTQRFLDHSGYNLGLVYEGNGVLGMGGGRSFGVAQYVFYGHYLGLYSCNTIFHELSHTVDFSHNSNMTYGIWAGGIADTYYVNNVSTFPVNSPSYLNTSANPTLYK